MPMRAALLIWTDFTGMIKGNLDMLDGKIAAFRSLTLFGMAELVRNFGSCFFDEPLVSQLQLQHGSSKFATKQ